MALALPFRRFDVIDSHLTVLLTGTAPDRLEPARTSTLEPELDVEVRRLMRDRHLNAGPVTTGLIGLEYGVRLIDRPEMRGATLVCTERLAIRGAFERLVARAALDAHDIEHARLLLGGYAEPIVAWRLGIPYGNAVRRQRDLLRTLGVPSRAALVDAVFARRRSGADTGPAHAARRSYLRPA